MAELRALRLQDIDLFRAPSQARHVLVINTDPRRFFHPYPLRVVKTYTHEKIDIIILFTHVTLYNYERSQIAVSC